MGFNETFQHVIHVLRERGCTLKSGGVRVATVRFSLNGIEMYKRCTKETGRSVRSIRSDRAGIKEWSRSAYALPQRLLTHNRVPLTRRGVRQLCVCEKR